MTYKDYLKFIKTDNDLLLQQIGDSFWIYFFGNIILYNYYRKKFFIRKYFKNLILPKTIIKENEFKKLYEFDIIFNIIVLNENFKVSQLLIKRVKWLYNRKLRYLKIEVIEDDYIKHLIKFFNYRKIKCNTLIRNKITEYENYGIKLKDLEKYFMKYIRVYKPILTKTIYHYFWILKNHKQLPKDFTKNLEHSKFV